MTKLTDAEKVNIMNDLLYSFKDNIDSNRFKELYEHIYKYYDYDLVPEITGFMSEVFINANINVLKYTNTIPSYYGYFNNLIPTSYIIPNNIIHMESNAFDNCLNLETISTNFVTLLEDESFADCQNLKIAYLHAIEHIRVSVFRGCYNLKELYLPYGLTYISPNWFGGHINCYPANKQLTIYYEGSEEDFKTLLYNSHWFQDEYEKLFDSVNIEYLA